MYNLILTDIIYMSQIQTYCIFNRLVLDEYFPLDIIWIINTLYYKLSKPSIKCKYNYSSATSSNGDIYMWGDLKFLISGKEISMPQKLNFQTDIIKFD